MIPTSLQSQTSLDSSGLNRTNFHAPRSLPTEITASYKICLDNILSAQGQFNLRRFFVLPREVNNTL